MPVTSRQNILGLSICLKILDLSPNPSPASLDRRNSPATLGLEMSEKPTNGPGSPFSRSAAMTANNSHGSCASRACAASKQLITSGCFVRNKQLNTQGPLIMSGFNVRRPKIGFVSHPTHILERFLMFSIRWALFRIFPLSASIRVNLRPNDFSQESHEWLCLEKCRLAGRRGRTHNSGRPSKESE
jgi:hypothetical protein